MSIPIKVIGSSFICLVGEMNLTLVLPKVAVKMRMTQSFHLVKLYMLFLFKH